MKKFNSLALLGSAALIALGAPLSAWAEVCEHYCDQYIEGRCVKYGERCKEDEPQAYPRYGAIAYGRHSGAYGYSYGWENRAKAERVAMKNCEKHGNDCEAMVWFDRKCGAVAATSGGAAYWGIGDTANAAKASAKGKCGKEHGDGCEVKASQCSW